MCWICDAQAPLCPHVESADFGGWCDTPSTTPAARDRFMARTRRDNLPLASLLHERAAELQAAQVAAAPRQERATKRKGDFDAGRNRALHSLRLLFAPCRALG